ncbi:hypothetical protein ACPV4B_04025 [Vibrio parahaemolyticus]|uniref:hypothetical protein n=1 Tax=Vibrio mediterranei TaxID=689 RepID=UPI00406965EC
MAFLTAQTLMFHRRRNENPLLLADIYFHNRNLETEACLADLDEVASDHVVAELRDKASQWLGE